jgi:uncharacterized protein (TIGR00730 family)
MASNRTDKTAGRMNGYDVETALPISEPLSGSHAQQDADPARIPAPMSKPSLPKTTIAKSEIAKSTKTAVVKPAVAKTKSAKSAAAKPKAPAVNVNSTQPTGIRNICVYCGSGPGINPAYVATARALGQSLATADIGLVYGGGSLGLMGEVAKSTLAHGGRVTGIIPSFLSKKEQMLHDADELIVTDNMHERKMLMFERSDAFVALPGGIGTLEELVEQLTWSQLGRHTKPIIVANIDGFWAPFLALLKHMKSEAFIRPGLELGFVVVDRPEQIVPAAISAAEGAHGLTDPALLAKF